MHRRKGWHGDEGGHCCLRHPGQAKEAVPHLMVRTPRYVLAFAARLTMPRVMPLVCHVSKSPSTQETEGCWCCGGESVLLTCEPDSVGCRMIRACSLYVVVVVVAWRCQLCRWLPVASSAAGRTKAARSVTTPARARHPPARCAAPLLPNVRRSTSRMGLPVPTAGGNVKGLELRSIRLAQLFQAVMPLQAHSCRWPVSRVG